MRDRKCEKRAEAAAKKINQRLVTRGTKIGIVLGTGWGDLLPLERKRELEFAEIPGFTELRELPGHARRVAAGEVGGVPVVALRGRIHLNEAPVSRRLAEMARLQIEMLLKTGVDTLILTCAAGSVNYPPGIGDVCVVDGFVTLFAPEMPLYAGEFCSPEDTLDRGLLQLALEAGRQIPLDRRDVPQGERPFVCRGGHAMVRGPFFEGRRYDKNFLAQTGARVVGMSVLPEACVAALYPGTRVLALAFVTNGPSEVHSHEENLARSKAAAATLGGYLQDIITKIKSTS